MTTPSASEKSYYDFESNMPEDVHQLINKEALQEHLHQHIFRYQSLILSKHGAISHYIAPLGVHPDYPFAHLFRLGSTYMPEEVLCFLWYLCSVYTIGIAFDIHWLYQYINTQKGEKECLSTFLTWFAPLSSWTGKLRKSAKATNLPFKKMRSQGGLNPFFNPHTIYFFHRPVQVNPKSKRIHALPTLIHHNDYKRGVRPDFNIQDNKAYEDFQIHAFRLNNSRQTFPIPFQPNWSHYPVDYQMSLDEDLQYFTTRWTTVKFVNTKEQEPSSSDCPPEYFQDAQLPDDEMSIDDIAKRFNIDTETHKEFEEPEENYDCPGDYYGCCEKHIIKFEMDH